MGCRGNLALGQSLDEAAAGMVGSYSSSSLEVAQISESSQSTTFLPRVCVCVCVCLCVCVSVCVLRGRGVGCSGCLAVWLHKMEAAEAEGSDGL